MDHLSESLRLASAAPPPSGIDLDRLIAGERRSRRRRTWLTAGGAAALAVVAVLGTVTLVVGRGPGQNGYSVGAEPSKTAAKPDPGAKPEPVGHCTAMPLPPQKESAGTPGGSPASPPASLKPAPTEPVDAAVLRLSTVLNRALHATLPEMNFADAIHPNCADTQVSQDVPPFAYAILVIAKDAAGVGSIVVGLSQATTESRDDFGAASAPGNGLYETHEVRSDGTIVGWVSGGSATDGHYNKVGVLRPDGTYITLLAETSKRSADTNPVRPTPPATVAQLIAIGTDPALTLYP